MNNNKPIFQCAVYMGEEGVNVYSKDVRVITLLTKGSFIPLIPEWRISFDKAKTKTKLIFIPARKTIIKIQNKNTFLVCGPIKELALASTIPYFIHYIIERERAVKGKATIHAAAVSKNNRGVLILGKQGSGKTSITLELCRKYGYSLIGNDLVLVGFKKNTGYLSGGTKVFRLRATAIKHYNKDLCRFFKGTKNYDEWTNVAIIQPSDIKVSAERQIVSIQAVYFVHLYPPNHNFVAKKADKLFSRIYLHQIFSEYIRGSAIVPLFGNNLKYSDYLPSLDSKTFFSQRTRFIDWIIRHRNYKYLAGSISPICKFIDQHL